MRHGYAPGNPETSPTGPASRSQYRVKVGLLAFVFHIDHQRGSTGSRSFAVVSVVPAMVLPHPAPAADQTARSLA